MNFISDNGIQNGLFWKLRGKLVPKYKEPPYAMKDTKENLLTNKDEILNEALRVYKERFKNKEPIKELNEFQPFVKNYPPQHPFKISN